MTDADEAYDRLHGLDGHVQTPAHRARMERAWDEATQEGYALGWLHDFARDDLLARNPYRAADVQ